MSLVKLEWKESQLSTFLKMRADGPLTKNAYDIRLYHEYISVNHYKVVYRVFVNSGHDYDFKNLKDAIFWCLVLENREMIEKENVDILTA